MTVIEKQPAEHDKKVFRRLILGPAVLVCMSGIFLLLGVRPVFWLLAALGVAVGGVYSKLRFSIWIDYASWEERINAKQTTWSWNLRFFLFLFITNFSLSWIGSTISHDVADGITGLIMGGITGFSLWPVWLYQRRITQAKTD